MKDERESIASAIKSGVNYKIDKITKYQGLDILISEDVNDNEFKIG